MMCVVYFYTAAVCVYERKGQQQQQTSNIYNLTMHLSNFIIIIIENKAAQHPIFSKKIIISIACIFLHHGGVCLRKKKDKNDELYICNLATHFSISSSNKAHPTNYFSSRKKPLSHYQISRRRLERNVKNGHYDAIFQLEYGNPRII